jgi:hypothetical protein
VAVKVTPVNLAIFGATAGWRGTDLIVAVAVGMATSAGQVDRPGGLWGGGPSGPTDGQANANAAFARWQQSGWGSFPAHNHKTYLLFMPAATAATASADVQAIVRDPAGAADKLGGAIADAAGQLPGGDILDAAKNALTLMYKAGAWMANPDNWVRVASVMLGGGLIIGGLFLVAKQAAGTLAGDLAGSIAKPIVKQTLGGTGGIKVGGGEK